MIQAVSPLQANTRLEGEALIPASKSHTIRALLVAALADGESTIINPLESKDARSCLDAIHVFGAEVQEISGQAWGAERAIRVKGVGASASSKARGILAGPADNVVDTGNSGTTLYLAASIAGVSPGWTIFTGDHQIRNRPIGNLLQALRDLGCEAFATKNNGCAPVAIRGPFKGGSTTIACPTSQFLSSLLLALPLADAEESTINISLLYEKPYAEMTLRWLDTQGIQYENVDSNWNTFRIPGRQHYKAFTRVVPGDFSSATFFAVAAAITGSSLVLTGLDMQDSQGDKAIFGVLEHMGCVVDYDKANSASGIRITGPGHPNNPQKHILGGEFDFNGIPDALPAFSVLSCFASEEVRIVNVPQARLKETDRIAVMRSELTKLGARVDEREDGLVIKPAGHALRGTDVDGHDDHRIVMSLALAGLRAEGETRISTAECAAVTYPTFFKDLSRLGTRTTSVGA